MSASFKLQYFFDPLCGWCYASAPALAALADRYPEALELMPSGLFADAGARPMSRQWADYAWTNDQRIQQLTGQRFSQAYHDQVLHGEGVRFDSGFATRALTAAGLIDRALEPRLMHALQLARYVDGRDTSRPEVVAEVTASVLANFSSAAQVSFDAQQFAARLSSDAELFRASAERVGYAQTLMQQRRVSGVPLLWVSTGTVETAIQGHLLHEGGPALLVAIDELFHASAAGQVLTAV